MEDRIITEPAATSSLLSRTSWRWAIAAPITRRDEGREDVDVNQKDSAALISDYLLAATTSRRRLKVPQTELCKLQVGDCADVVLAFCRS